MTVTTPGLLLVQMPPEAISDKFDVPPAQRIVTPDIIDGIGFTVTNALVRHPVDNA